MPDDTAAQRPQPIKEGVTNPTRGSKVQAQAEYGPMFLFRPETGEIIAVPAQEVNVINKEIGEWNMLIATLHAANAQVQFFDDEMVKQALQPDRMTPGAHNTAQRNWEIAADWQEEVIDTCQLKIKSLAKIGSGGKQLVELIPLPSIGSGKMENKAGEMKEGKYTKEIKASWGTGTKSVPSKDWIRPRKGSLVYVDSEKLKSNWPKFKDPDNLKWADVVQKDASGKCSINGMKALRYVKQTMGKANFQLKDFVKLDVDVEGSIGSWATAWNADTSNTASGKVKITAGPVTGDVELDAGAQFMRYLYGGSLNLTFEPTKADVAFRAEGHAELAIAEAKATATVHFPAKEGWMWTLPAPLADIGVAAKDIDLGAVRLTATLELKGAVGASVAAEISLGVENRIGQTPVIVGKKTRKRRRRRAKKVSVVEDMGPEKKMRVAGVEGTLDAFAGLKADAEIKGAIEWRNPENQKKEFEAFAVIAPALGAMAGIGGTAKLLVQYADGIFRVHADAALCIGLGAEGKLSFEVSAKLLVSFVKWFFYQLYNANFKRLDFLEESAFTAMKYLYFLAIVQGNNILNNFGMVESELALKIRQVKSKFSDAKARHQLAQRILADPEALRYAPPETKGMLIHDLCSNNNVDWMQSGFGIGNSYLIEQKSAIKKILMQWSHTRTECENTIQHISADGAKGSYLANLARLKRFLNQELPGNIDLPGVNTQHGEDFDVWYEKLSASLKDGPTRGFHIVPSNSLQYAMERNKDFDHPLFASAGEGAFYA
ncbi:hypothetical protein [Pseudoduganella buxea]|uniref:Uncharacterized protein n=1 Tax=Pseudoduganella buxea TaxID=1949069 RepID=A0A6I3T3B1_9BURK|nr:hypothetical protein [Pseudoduganella buxea]MTV54952.1 hypothetical protein [Pseudoduganella buxea]GGC17288.1 hypothetical protein GCM10011572_43270 [Pseudoduganella buxea]